MRRRSPIVKAAVALILAVPLAHAQTRLDDPDLDALKLADSTSAQAEPARAWRAFVEGALGDDRLRADGAWQPRRRLSTSLRYEAALGTDWRVAWADQVDWEWPADTPDGTHGINTFKEGYATWQARPDVDVDLGRVNVRNGVATGYNPTDYFKDGAVRSIISVDPASLRENRQGSVMLRVQHLWAGGAVTALASPALSQQTDAAGFSPDWGATNGSNRWLLAISQELAPGLSPQWLAYQAAGQSVQLGANLTLLPNDATVAFLEASAGYSQSLLNRSLQRNGLPVADDRAWRQRVSTGLTFTTAYKLSITGELEYNGNGLDSHPWDRLQHGPLAVYGLYRNDLTAAQEPPTRRAAFTYVRWQDALWNRLDLSAMVRFDIDDRSGLGWVEARYRFTHAEMALQWQHTTGTPLSNYGATAQAQRAQVELRHYF